MCTVWLMVTSLNDAFCRSWELTIFSIAVSHSLEPVRYLTQYLRSRRPQNSRLILHLRSSPVSRIPKGTRTRSKDPWSRTSDTDTALEMTKIEFESDVWCSRNDTGAREQVASRTTGSGTAVERSTIDVGHFSEDEDTDARRTTNNRGDWLEEWERV
jgi:hypothetical protein